MLDETEVAKFDALADHWWDLNGKLQTLHQINPVRLAFIKKYLDQKPPALRAASALNPSGLASSHHALLSAGVETCSLSNKKILDVGCGGGILTERLAREGALLTGIDASSTAIHVAKTHAQSTGLPINYQTVTVEDMAESYPAHFDALTCMELLEHVPDPAAMIQQCAKLVKPGGMVFFSTINRTLKAYGLAIIGAEYLLKRLPKGTHAYEKLIKPAELDSWARAAKLDRVAIAGMHYNPFTQQAKLTQDVSVNFLACYMIT